MARTSKKGLEHLASLLPEQGMNDSEQCQDISNIQGCEEGETARWDSEESAKSVINKFLSEISQEFGVEAFEAREAPIAVKGQWDRITWGGTAAYWRMPSLNGRWYLVHKGSDLEDLRSEIAALALKVRELELKAKEPVFVKPGGMIALCDRPVNGTTFHGAASFAQSKDGKIVNMTVAFSIGGADRKYEGSYGSTRQHDADFVLACILRDAASDFNLRSGASMPDDPNVAWVLATNGNVQTSIQRSLIKNDKYTFTSDCKDSDGVTEWTSTTYNLSIDDGVWYLKLKEGTK